MIYSIFEDKNYSSLYPFNINHPSFDFRCGAYTNLERVSNHLNNEDSIQLVVREELAGLVKERYPDLIVNPHAIPSRMTINQLLEMILGKSCSLTGHLGDATPFQNNDITNYTQLLSKLGYEGMGNEVLYSGITGEQLRTSIFMGPIYYQRIKLMVADKMHSRGTGPVQALVRQPAAGRANNGGLRIGEMERDSILSHGTSSFLQETVMTRSDKYSVQIDENTGLIDYSDTNSIKHQVHMPYAMKLLIQELQTMCIYPRIEIDTEIPNKPVFQHLLNNLMN